MHCRSSSRREVVVTRPDVVILLEQLGGPEALRATRPALRLLRELLATLEACGRVGGTLDRLHQTTAGLSPRQKETLAHMKGGLSEKEIARRLARSKHTVHCYVKEIYRRFHVRSRSELMALFVRS